MAKSTYQVTVQYRDGVGTGGKKSGTVTDFTPQDALDQIRQDPRVIAAEVHGGPDGDASFGTFKNMAFSNGRQKAQKEIANRWPVLNAKTVTYYRGSDGTCYDVEDGWSGAHSIRVEAPRKMMLERMTPEQFNSFKSSRGLQVISKQECDKK